MNAQTLEPYLKKHPFFKGLSSDYLAILVGCVKNVSVEALQPIFQTGEPADHFFLIRQGAVAIETSSLEAGAVTIQTLGNGDVLGWSWLFEPYRWNFDARALMQTRLFSLDAKCLRDKCDRDPAFGYDLVKRFSRVMVDRLQATRLQLLDIYALPTGE